MEPSLADLLATNRAGVAPDMAPGVAMIPGLDPSMGGSAAAKNPAMAALGAQAMQRINQALPAQQTSGAISPGGAGIAPRGQQIQLAKPAPGPTDIDPRVKLGLAQLLFGGK
jgi:hypothetical protein